MFPGQKGDVAAEVVIIGAGLTGSAVAYACAAAGMRPLVLEADRVGTGTTAFGAGLILPEPGPAFRDVVAAQGLRTAKRAFGAWRRAALDAAALLRRLKIKCDLTPLDALTVTNEDAERGLRKEYDARVDAGLDLAWLAERQVRAATRADVASGFRQSGAFGFDPYRACVGLAIAARARGATFHENSPVVRIRPGRNHVNLVCERGTVQAGAVIVATGTATTLFAPLRRHFTVRDTYHVLTSALPPAVRRQVGAADTTLRDSHAPPHRLRWTSDHQVLIAGAEQAEAPARRRDALVKEWTFELMYELLKMYPAISGLQPAYGWRLSSGMTRDGLPYIGAHRNYPRHLFALGGGVGESSTGAFLAARLLVRALEGESDPGDDAFGFTR